MENQHLKNFKIENFKKFESLEVKDIGQFNLIVGDNNVGKTILLESLCLELNPKNFLSDLEFILSKRYVYLNNIKFDINNFEFNAKANVVGLVQNDINKPINITHHYQNEKKQILRVSNKFDFNPSKDKKVKTFIDNVDLFQYKEINQLSKNWILFESNNDNNKLLKNEKIIFLADVNSTYYKQFLEKSNYLPLIKLVDLYADDLFEFFNKIISSPKDEEHLLSIINEVVDLKINRIRTSEYINNTEFLQISTKYRENYHPLTDYGDGLIRILRIIAEIIINKNRKICIDEFDVGIHYSKLKNFWKIIINLCLDFNIQLFATTHSQECIKAFIEANSDISIKNNIRLIKLQENKDKSIKAITYPYNEFQYLVESETETR